MTFRWHVLLAVAACTAPVRPPPARQIERASRPALPAALADGAEAELHTRARVARAGAIRFEPGAAPLTADREPAGAGGELGVPAIVAAQDDARVQLRADVDDARLLVWIDRADLAPVFVKAQALVDPRTGARGAVARPGAAARVVHAGERGVDVEVDDGALVVSGRTPPAALGTVYEERPPRHPTTDTVVMGDEQVRAAPDGERIATTDGAVMVHALAPPQGSWLEVEIDRPFLYVRGYVRAASTAPELPARDLVSTSALGWSDAPTLLLPAGACLYARPGGPIIGVNEAERLRYAHDGGEPGWRKVGVMTPWGLVWPEAHFPEKRGAPTGDYDRCVTRRESRSR
jgi:hypothetical protein